MAYNQEEFDKIGARWNAYDDCKYYIREYVNGEQVAIHTLYIPGFNKPKHYTGILSIGFFERRQLMKFHPDPKKKVKMPRWFSVKRWIEYEEDQYRWNNSDFCDRHPDSKEPDAKLLVIEHKSLFEFYDYIGWDRKKMKLTK